MNGFPSLLINTLLREIFAENKLTASVDILIDDFTDTHCRAFEFSDRRFID